MTDEKDDNTLRHSVASEKAAAISEKADVDNTVENAPDDSPPISTGAAHSDAPDGGLLAWLQVVGSFFLFVNSWGICNSFGAFQTYYELELLSSSSPSSIAWIGSIQAFLLMMSTLYTGWIFDMGYMHTLLGVGSFMVVFGMMMTSISTEYYQVLLAQGICVGLGSGCLFISCVAVVATYFNKKRSLAIGVSAAGSSIGGTIFPAVFRQLQPQIGFGWATRVIGFIALGTLAISMAVMRQRIRTKEKRKLFDMDAWKSWPFTFFTTGLFFCFMGLYIPFFYISTFASFKTGASPTLAFYFLSITNGASTLGRLLPNIIADRLGPINMLIPCTTVTTIIVFCWIPVHDVGGLSVFAVIYGFFSGSFVSLPPSVIASLCPDLRLVGTRLGMSFAVASLGLLIGSPIGGALINLNDGEFLHAQIFCGVILLVGWAFVVCCRVSKVGWTFRVRA